MSSESIKFDGMKYISTSEAAKLTGYTSDYIGQLARAKKVHSRMVGRARFVDEKEIVAYKNNPSISVLQKMTNEYAKSVATRIQKIKKVEKNVRVERKQKEVTTKYIPDDGLLVSEISKSPKGDFVKEKIETRPLSIVTSISAMFGIHPSKIFVAVSLLAVLIVGTTYIFGNYSIHENKIYIVAEVQDVFVAGIGGVSEIIETLTSFGEESGQASTNTVFINTWYRIQFGIHTFATETYNMFANFLSPSETSNNNLFVQKSSGVRDYDGLIVVPSSGSANADKITIDQIKYSFSDEVSVFPDETGRSGVIRPIFKKTLGQPFLYVLVPLEEGG